MLSLLVVLASTIDNSYARENTDIGITLSKTCITMIKNNITNNCPNYEDIMVLFPDTSNQDISGKFIYDDGFYQRDNTNFKSHFEFYTYEPHTTWIDPPGDIVGGIPTITIEPRLNEYLIPESNRLENNTLTVGTSIWVDPLCYRATIGADSWILEMGHLMQYIDHNCDEEFKNFKDTKNITFKKSYQDITTSYKYKLDKWIEESKIKCLTICKEY